MSAVFAVVRACPYCNVVPQVEGSETPVAVHYCKADRNNLMVVKMSLWQQRPVEDALKKDICDAVAEERALNYPLIELLEGAGMGKPGTPNTLWAMVREIVGKYKSCVSTIEEAGRDLGLLNELAIELAVMNNTLLNSSGDLPEKSAKNFAAEVKRLTDALFWRVKKGRAGQAESEVANVV